MYVGCSSVGNLWRSIKYVVLYFLASAAGGPNWMQILLGLAWAFLQCNRFVCIVVVVWFFPSSSSSWSRQKARGEAV